MSTIILNFFLTWVRCFFFRSSGVLVPGGFGTRGVEGKIAAIEWARTKGKPFLGICLGLQCAVIEFARHVLGLKGANSAEFDKTEHQVVCLPNALKRILKNDSF